MKIYKLTPKAEPYFDMGIKGRCTALYIKAKTEDDARGLALLNKQLSTAQDTIPGYPSSLFEDMFNAENANCVELSHQKSQNIVMDDDLGINLIKIDC